MTRLRDAAAFTLAELLIAMALTLVICGAVFALVTPATQVFVVEPEVHDLQQRGRVAIETVRRDLYGAGAGMHAGWASGPLHRFIAPIRPFRIGERRPDLPMGVFHRPDVVSVLAVPLTVAQAVVRRLVFAGGVVGVEVEPNCGPGMFPDRVCGFRADMRVLLVDRWGRSAFGTVTAVDGHTVLVESQGFRGDVDPESGAALTEVTVNVYGIGADPATGAPRLMRYDGYRSELPVVDHVVNLVFEYFGAPRPPELRPGADVEQLPGPWTTYGPAPPPAGIDLPEDLWGAGENCVFVAGDAGHAPRLPRLAPGDGLVRLDAALFGDGPWCPDAAHPDRFDADLLRIRRVRLVVRLEAPDALRGPAGPLFQRPGSASGRQLVPDHELRIDVTPRNLNLER